MKHLIIFIVLSITSLSGFSYYKYNAELGLISGNGGLYSDQVDTLSADDATSDLLQLGGAVSYSVGFEYFVNKLVSTKISFGSYSDTLVEKPNSLYPAYKYRSGSIEAMVYAHTWMLFNNRISTQVGVGVNIHSDAKITYQKSATAEEKSLHDLENNAGYDFELRFNTRKLNRNYHYYFGYRYNLRKFLINNSTYSANGSNIFFGMAI